MDNKKIRHAKAFPQHRISYACLLTLLMRSFHFALLSVRMTSHVMLRLVRSIALMINIPSLRGLKARGNLIKYRILSIAFRDCFAPRRAFSPAITTCKSAVLDYSGRSVFHSASENLSIFFHSIRLSLFRVPQLRCSLYRKSAFTFAELMISLVVISILAAVLYPNLMHFNPNSNKPLFKAAYKILSNALAEITVDKPNGTLTTTNTVGGLNSGQQLCIDFCNKANVVDEQVAPNNTCTQNCNDQILTTSNGMRWLFENYATNYPVLEYHVAPIPNKSAFRITVDVNSSNSDLPSAWHCTIGGGLSFHAKTVGGNKGIFCYTNADDSDSTKEGIYENGKTPSAANVNGTFYLDNAKAQDTFQFLVDEKGKIISISPVGWAILEDNVQLD